MDPAATTEPLTAIWVDTWTRKPIGCRLYAGREVCSAASGHVTQARPHLIARMQVDQHSVTVRHFGRKIAFPHHVAPAVGFALSQKRFAVRDLPGDLDDSGKLTLVRRLTREGLLVACPT